MRRDGEGAGSGVTWPPRGAVAAWRAVAPAATRSAGARLRAPAQGEGAARRADAKAPGAEEGTPVEALIPPRPTVAKLRDAAAGCRACRLWKLGTQTVFGEGAGPAADAIMLVGEQPGDQEDLAGPSVRRPGGRAVVARGRGGGPRSSRASTSPTRSSTSSGSRAASGASTRSLTSTK